MRIGTFQLKDRVMLAPMAGITDLPFRRICSKYGASLTFSEMMSANRDTWHTEKSKLRLAHHDDIGINAVQIAGSNPDEMAAAAQINVGHGAQLIDINMGCPAKKVNRKMAGSALLQEPQLVADILQAVVDAVTVPVTLKIRTGWDRDNRNCLQIAEIAEKAGIQALTIHGRTRSCLFKGNAEYDSIREVKQNASIPIIANGDITSPQQAEFVLDYTNADAVMIGRGALGRPWLFSEINHYLSSGDDMIALSLNEKCETALNHIRALHQFYGAQKGYRVARKHVAWYLSQIHADDNYRAHFNKIDDAEVQLSSLEEYFQAIQLNC